MPSSRHLAKLILGLSLVLPLGGLACGAEEDANAPDNEEDAHEVSEENLTTAEKEALCNAIPRRPITAAEGQVLLTEVSTRFAKLKRDNDALIAARGIGGFAGGRSEFLKLRDAGNIAAATQLVRSRLKPGYDPVKVTKEIAGTSCIGRVYAVLRESYAVIGRAADWPAIEKCGRAWDSDGLHVQQALIKSGWPSPAVGLATDVASPPGNAADIALHRTFLRARAGGSYYGVPLSQSVFLRDFMPSPGSRTREDLAPLLQLGRASFLSVATLRGAYHVPFIVPAASVPLDVAPNGPTRQAWVDARTRGEPFVLESHLTRAPWDPTNFEIRPLREVIRESFGSSATYGTGTMLFAPGSSFPVAP